MVQPGIIENAMAKLSRPGVLFKRKNINNGSGVNNNNSNEGEKTKEMVLGLPPKRGQTLSKAVQEMAEEVAGQGAMVRLLEARLARLVLVLKAEVAAGGDGGGDSDVDNDGDGGGGSGGGGGDGDGGNDGKDKTEEGSIDSILSSILSVLSEKLTSPYLLNSATRDGVGSKLNKLNKMFGLIKALLPHAEKKLTYGLGAVKMWLDDLRDLAYDTEDILDEYATEALRRMLKIEEQGSGADGDGSGANGDGSGGDGGGSGGDGGDDGDGGGDNDDGDKTEGGGKMEPETKPKGQHDDYRNRFSYHGGDENGYPVGQLHIRCYYEKPNVCSIIPYQVFA